MRKIMLAIAGAIMLVLSLSGCAPKTVDVKPLIVQEALLEKCTDDTPVPSTPARTPDGKIMVDADGKTLYDGAETLRVLTKWDGIYGECAMRHDALVDLIRKIQGQIDIKK